MKVFFSNRYEVLADRLRDKLFFTPCHPLKKRWVVVPSQTVKNDLLYRWAQDSRLRVATGVKVVSLNQALNHFFPKIPSQTELSLKIETCLEKNPVLDSYLQNGGPKRLIGLCDELSALFLRRGTFRGQPFSEEWLEKLWQKVDLSWEPSPDTNFPIYLFNISFLPQLHLEFFKKIAQAVFFVSPTPLYWGDIATPEEQQFFLKKRSLLQKEELKRYFKNQNQLIANLGKMGRRFWIQLQEEEIEEDYAEPENFALHQQMMALEPLNLEPVAKLHLDQNPRFHLPELDSKESFASGSLDNHIEIHAAFSKGREVEVVWELVQRLDTDSKEILILAPDINEYVPHIHKVFEGQEYTIWGLDVCLDHVEHLFKIPQKKFSIEAVLKLFSYSPFLEKFAFSTEEVDLIKKWAQKANFYTDGCDRGFERMIDALISSSEEDLVVEFSQAELLSRWIEVTELLIKELRPVEENRLMRVDAWATYFRKTVDRFFIVKPDDIFFAELRCFEKIKTGEYSFESIERVLEEIFRKKTGVFQSANLKAIRFGSLTYGSLIPARTIFVMGLDEGNFPRPQKRGFLAEMEGDYCPTQIEEDRYLFLQLILSVREKLVLTYPFIDPEDGKEVRPSLLIEELFSKIKVHIHPFLSFDSSYFQEGGFRSCSQLNFLTAQSYYKQEKQGLKPLVFIPEKLQRKEENCIDLRHLKKLARHPIQFFFEKKLGIYFDSIKKKDSPFSISPLDLAYFRKMSLKKDLGEIFQEASQRGRLPVGHFKEIAIRRIEEEITAYHKTLSALNIQPKEIFSVEFKLSCDAPLQMREDEWIVPPLEIFLNEGSSVKIIGRLENLCIQGLIFHGEDKLEDYLKIWPLYLITLHLPLPIKSHLLLTEKGVRKENFFPEPAKALSHFINYYCTASENLSILMPKWGRAILEKGVVKPEEEDEIVNWFLQRDPMIWKETWIERWTPLLKETYYELL